MMLSPYRILDIAADESLLLGQLLAQLGAEVITLEDDAAPRSLERSVYGRGRTSLSTTPDGRADDVAALAATADVVIGSDPTELSRLAGADPTLVTVSVTPFGSDGPKAGWAGGDLALAAASGQMILTGDSDRAPVRISEPQAFHHASIEGAVHVVAALMERQRSGLGQHLDVSAQHALLQASQMNMLAAAVGAPDMQRFGGGMRIGPYQIRLVYPAADGHVTVTFLFGDMIGRFTQRLMAWVHDEGHCSDEIRDLDYISFFELIFGGQLAPEKLTEASDAVAACTRAYTKAELLEIARKRQLLIAPVATTVDSLGFEHFGARGYWEPVAWDNDTVRLPGAWARPTRTPLRPLGPPRPVGADDHRRTQVRTTRPSPPLVATEAGHPGPSSRPCDGLRVLDFSWVLAGPMATRLLADLGATVIRIESESRPDVIRSAGPFLAGRDGPEDTALWHSAAAGKYSVQLDLSTEAGRGVAVDLAGWAELVFESYSPGAIASMGLGYDELSSGRDDLVMVSSSLLGQTGPLADFAGFGNLAAALAGFFEITGWPDRPPAGPFTAYTDYVSPRFAALISAAAVDHARRTGEGQYIDLAQAEAALHLLTPALVLSELTGTPAPRRGNADPVFCPHGVYPASGEDRWIAIAALDDEQWQALAGWLGRSDLGGLTADERRGQEADLDALIAAHSAGRDAEELQAELQGIGVAAHQVQHSTQMLADPQMQYRRHAQQVPHDLHGEVWVEGSQVRWSRTQPDPQWGGPTVGQHTHEILTELLGYDSDRVAELVIAGAIA